MTGRVTLAEGAGGRSSERLLSSLVLPALGSAAPESLGDAAPVPGSGGLVMTTDSFVVRPRLFPGGCLGSLAVHGTVNDLAVMGAAPLAMTVGLVLEEGFPHDELRHHLEQMGVAATASGVRVVAGDTKVVEAGAADGMFLTCAGVGRVDSRAVLGRERVRVGDRIVLSGPVGDHGVAVMLARGELGLEADVNSDSRSLWPLVHTTLTRGGGGVRWMRDATRGGLATVLGELAAGQGWGVRVEEALIPVGGPTRGACELLGLDPLYVANEGCFAAVVAPSCAAEVVAALARCEGGERASVVGEIVARPDPASPAVTALTAFGGERVLGLLAGDPLPRIC